MKVVFLDRDGVINEFPGNGNYVTTVKNFQFIDGSLNAIRDLTQGGYSIFVVSNQAGVGKGIYSKTKLMQITKKMLNGVRAKGGKIRRVFYCTHRRDHNCDCRKPQIGSIIKAFKILDKGLHHAKKAYFIGDTESDIQAGKNAGCQTIFVLSGRENRRHLRGWRVKPDYICKNLFEASKIVMKNGVKN